MEKRFRYIFPTAPPQPAPATPARSNDAINRLHVPTSLAGPVKGDKL